MTMETLQWTLLVGLLAMVVYVLWHRMRASFVEGVAPKVAADWEGEALMVKEDVLTLRVRVQRAGKVDVGLKEAAGAEITIHSGDLAQGVHEWGVEVPKRGQWVAKLTCEGHRSERRLPS
jgi:hypothetical protein